MTTKTTRARVADATPEPEPAVTIDADGYPVMPACIRATRCFGCRCLLRALLRQAALDDGSRLYSQLQVDAELAFALDLVESDHAAILSNYGLTRGRRRR